MTKTYWFQEINKDGNHTTYSEDGLSNRELDDIIENYQPSFDGCFLDYGVE